MSLHDLHARVLSWQVSPLRREQKERFIRQGEPWQSTIKRGEAAKRCYVMLCDAMWCYVMLCDAMWCYVMLDHEVLSELCWIMNCGNCQNLLNRLEPVFLVSSLPVGRPVQAFTEVTWKTRTVLLAIGPVCPVRTTPWLSSKCTNTREGLGLFKSLENLETSNLQPVAAQLC